MVKSQNQHFQRLGRFSLRYRRSVAGVIFCATFGILNASLVPMTAPISIRDTSDWILPQIEQQPLSSDIDTILANPLFGGEPIIAKEPEAETFVEENEEGEPWRLLGIITEGNIKHVVILNESSGKTQVAQLGDILPGGEELVAVDANEIEIFHNDESQTLSLFVDKNTKE